MSCFLLVSLVHSKIQVILPTHTLYKSQHKTFHVDSLSMSVFQCRLVCDKWRVVCGPEKAKILGNKSGGQDCSSQCMTLGRAAAAEHVVVESVVKAAGLVVAVAVSSAAMVLLFVVSYCCCLRDDGRTINSGMTARRERKSHGVIVVVVVVLLLLLLPECAKFCGQLRGDAARLEQGGGGGCMVSE